jgi:hypothetical protein
MVELFLPSSGRTRLRSFGCVVTTMATSGTSSPQLGRGNWTCPSQCTQSHIGKVKVTISSERIGMESLPTETETGPAMKDISGSIK